VSSGFQFVRALTPEVTREIVTEACAIADEHGGDGDRWPHVFAAACGLLGNGVMVPPQAPAALSVADLRRMAGSG
jgi:hypothetical protein